MSYSEDILDSIPQEDDRLFVAAKPGAANPLHEEVFAAFNTVVTMRAAGDEALVRQAFDQAILACRRFERLLSRTLPHSDVSRLNQAGGARVDIDDLTFEVLELSLFYCRESLGTFDITIGSATRLWNFYEKRIPTDEQLTEAVRHVDFRMLELGGEPGARWAQLHDPLASVDVGGTAKGYIADALCDLLQGAGLSHLFVNLGGNVAARGGKPDGSPWRIGIKNPQDPNGVLGAVDIVDGSVVTSGLYERSFVLDGVRYAHILNPATGRPVVTDVEGVSVIGARSTDCEGFSTTLCALGLERGLEFARSRPEISQAVFVDAQNNLHVAR